MQITWKLEWQLHAGIALSVCVFQVIVAVQRRGQTRVQWSILLDQAFHLEDVAKSQSSPLRVFTHSFPLGHNCWIRRFVYTPTVGEFIQCQDLMSTGGVNVHFCTFTQLYKKKKIKALLINSTLWDMLFHYISEMNLYHPFIFSSLLVFFRL